MTTQTEPGDTSEPPKDSVDELHANATGVWAVRSTSTTVYYLDLDRRRLLRLRGGVGGQPRRTVRRVLGSTRKLRDPGWRTRGGQGRGGAQ